MSALDNPDLFALEAAKSRMGEFAWPTVILGVTVTGAYVATPFLVASSLLPVWLAVPLMISLAYASYTVLHEAVHGSINGSHKSLRWLNELMGYMAAFVLGIPMTAHRQEHLAHHRHTNDAQADPDHVVAEMTKSLPAAVKAALDVIRAQFFYYINHRWDNAPRGQNVRFCLEIVVAIALRVLIIMLTTAPISLLLFLAAGVGGIMLTMYLFAYLVHVPHESVGRYVDTSTVLVRGPLAKLVTWLWLFQNYHSIHHLFPRVPFYRYAAVFDEIRPVMEARQAPIYELGLGGMRPVEPCHSTVPA